MPLAALAARPTRLARRLAGDRLARFDKSAAGPGDAAGFEQEFARLAYAQIQDKEPKLLEYLVGFQTVDRSADKTKACGVWGINVGGLWLFAPAFYVAGEMKGDELLYVKDWDVFVPLTPDWVNHLLARRPARLGRGERPEGTPPIDTRMDPARVIKGFTVRTAADGFADRYLGRPVLGPGPHGRLFADLVLGRPAARAAADPLFPKLAAADPEAAAGAVLMAYADPAVRLGMDRHFGPGFVAGCADRWQAAAVDRASRLDPLTPPAGPVKAAAAVRVVVRTMSVAGLDQAPPAVRRAIGRLVSDLAADGLPAGLAGEAAAAGAAADDTRDPAGLGRAAAVPGTGLAAPAYQGVSEPGVYQVATAGGGTRRCFCTPLQGGPGRALKATLAVPLDGPNDFAVARADRVLAPVAAAATARSAVMRAVESLPDAAMRPGEVVMAVDPHGVTSRPFRVAHRQADGVYAGQFVDRLDDPRDECSWAVPAPGGWRGHVFRVTGLPGRRLYWERNELFVPAGFRVVSLGEGGSPLQPASRADVDAEWDGIGRVEVAARPGGRVSVTDKTAGVVGWQAAEPLAAAYLAEAYAVPLAEAAAAVAEARGGGRPVTVLLKRGNREAPTAIPDMVSAPAMPPEELQPAGIPRLGLVELLATQYRIPLDTARPQVDPSRYDPFYRPDEQSVGLAARAAESGQKEVFDTGLIAALAKSTGRSRPRGNLTRRLTSAMDGCGRELFELYYRPEQAADRYGRGDVAEMEELYRDAFDLTGKLVLQLKERDGDQDGGLGGVGGADEPAGPGD